ncbi:putative rRNA maturation factor [Anaerosolibacter carboniphilus]|uniref:Endoribonuclease YbeY n=1 Tax=Anaerosolibacter carboniphilus TaxID=1417629 RepID=A0A841KWU8_9FIRM|nr:rRNA maturation RNase YbeY [Anaerosolibacter carboniphilus]MBB6217921.1 putative rRNA maturation factor [Anaerosolibacter carboniphilus]
MEVAIDNRQSKVVYGGELEKLIVNAIEMSLKIERMTDDVEVSVSLVDNQEIHQLNQEYRNIDRPTDVLSFPLYDSFENMTPPFCLGDIVISLEKALEQSKEYNHSFDREVAFLTVHSMFHLMGYDHDTEENTKQMRQKEEEVLQALGILRE